MSIYFDSSALVSAFVREEYHHREAAFALQTTKEGFTSTHSLAEVFSTLTSGRLPIQLSPRDANLLLDSNCSQRLSIVEVTRSDYAEARKASEAVGARGGAIYDLIHLQVARRLRAPRILTINLRHFQTFAPDLKQIISLP